MALNCGMGSNSLNAEVKAFDGLHIVGGWKSSCSGAKYKSHTPRQMLRSVQFVLHERSVYDQLGRCIGQLLCAPRRMLKESDPYEI